VWHDDPRRTKAQSALDWDRHHPLAISLIEKRLNDTFPGIKHEVYGTPKDLDGAKDLAQRDKYQFQW